MKRESLPWIVAVVVLVGVIVWRELPSWQSVAPWWMRPQLVDGRRVAEIRGRFQEALRRRVRCGLRARLAWAVCTSPATPAPGPTPTPSKPLRKDCPECNGTGRVRTGDGISWTTCDRCVPPTAPPASPPAVSPAAPAVAVPPPVVSPATPAAPHRSTNIPPAAAAATGPVYVRECGPGGCRMVRVR